MDLDPHRDQGTAHRRRRRVDVQPGAGGGPRGAGRRGPGTRGCRARDRGHDDPRPGLAGGRQPGPGLARGPRGGDGHQHRLHRVHLRALAGRGDGRYRPGPQRPGHRIGDHVAHPGLDRPVHLRPVRRWGRRGGDRRGRRRFHVPGLFVGIGRGRSRIALPRQQLREALAVQHRQRFAQPADGRTRGLQVRDPRPDRDRCRHRRQGRRGDRGPGPDHSPPGQRQDHQIGRGTAGPADGPVRCQRRALRGTRRRLRYRSRWPKPPPPDGSGTRSWRCWWRSGPDFPGPARC